jgi:hypothetical protein
MLESSVSSTARAASEDHELVFDGALALEEGAVHGWRWFVRHVRGSIRSWVELHGTRTKRRVTLKNGIAF